ncbi:hypothetical protein Patl1_35797 [Pistacia atlantica]|nr:hypothetical protein Patl1_35797 [Pistacia atlantica]
MINAKKLIKLAKKWQRTAALKRKRILLLGFNKTSTPSAAHKGHFVDYTVDQKSFVFPIPYLRSHIFQELLRMSEEEFGLPGNGPITLSCDASFMEYLDQKFVLIGKWRKL